MSLLMVTFTWVLPSCLVSKDTQNLTYASKKSYPVWHILPSILNNKPTRLCPRLLQVLFHYLGSHFSSYQEILNHTCYPLTYI